MMNFAKDVVFNLTKIDNSKINKNVAATLVDGEQVIGVYKTVRDQVVFTDKRIITVDVQGLTGKKQEIFTIPYARIDYYAIQTPGFLEINADSELVISFTNGLKAEFEFKGNCDIRQISKMIATYALR